MRDQEKQTPARNCEGFQQFVNRRNIVRCFRSGQRVHLQRHVDFLRPTDGLYGAIERARNAADRIVPLGGGTIETQAKTFNAVFLQSQQNVAREGGGGGGRDGNADAQATRFVDQIVQVLALERIAAGEDQLGQRIAKFGDLTQKSHAFLESELHGMRLRDGGGAAMAAGQGAGLRHLPVNIERGLGVITRFRVRGGAMDERPGHI